MRALALIAALESSGVEALAQQPDPQLAGVWRGTFADGYNTAMEIVLQANGRFSVSQISYTSQTFYGGYWSLWQGNNIRFDIDQWQTTPIATIPVAGENWIIQRYTGTNLYLSAPTCNSPSCVVGFQRFQ